MTDYDSRVESYLTMMREAVPGYDSLEAATVAATGSGANSILELGTGNGRDGATGARSAPGRAGRGPRCVGVTPP